MAKGVSSTSVIITSCAPPILYPNMYEIDMPSQAVLMTHRRMAEATDAIGLDGMMKRGGECPRPGAGQLYRDRDKLEVS